eukprot:gnl/TRDRNA2_/TRDRNA2_179017_c0_seq1.p1 gnl/TRDRNA2_/TRDRNA2_179017_c0~~gnl/TRDRNA2_/TRDRNA2_179017_c0_seq1.p1  ORF type:complete len:337 (+),score=62.94 gnl/TRDRNA2_/TRDRNA2_179017_c0_seq1:132-1142(+)
MAPVEDLQSRDLAWISDFVMQQMVIMLRPMMDSLQQTDASVDYAQRAVQRLSVDISEIRGDLERTNKYLAILRQGLGVQNEGRCVLQRGLENSQRTAKRLDEQMDSVLGVMRSVDESINQLRAETGAKHEESAQQINKHASEIQDVQAIMEVISKDTRALKDELLSQDARFEGFQRELRQLRRNELGIVTKLEDKVAKKAPSASAAAVDTWPQKKSPFQPSDSSTGGHTQGTVSMVAEPREPEKKRFSFTGSGKSFLQQVWGQGTEGPEGDESMGRAASATATRDEACNASRLPVLGKPPSQLPSVSKTLESAYTAGPRLRFSETMANPPSRGPAS